MNRMRRVEFWGDWTQRALCATPENKTLRWFPEDDQGMVDRKRQASDRRRVQMVCQACPVQAECRMYAETHHVTAGVWAGHNYGHRPVRETDR